MEEKTGSGNCCLPDQFCYIFVKFSLKTIRIVILINFSCLFVKISLITDPIEFCILGKLEYIGLGLVLGYFSVPSLLLQISKTKSPDAIGKGTDNIFWKGVLAI